MTGQHTLIETIKELIQLHRDRIALYQQALATLLRPDRKDLKAIFGEMIRASILYQQELRDSIAGLNGHGQEKEYKGAIYEVWESAKVDIEGDNSKSILEACEEECEAVQQAYEAALSFTNHMDDAIGQVLKMQQLTLKSIQDQIREYHDAL
jgi:uncharacterized protein (TIGR02284 family)